MMNALRLSRLSFRGQKLVSESLSRLRKLHFFILVIFVVQFESYDKNRQPDHQHLY